MITPQEVELTTSPNHAAEVKFDVRLTDVPVDIYFLMDLSKSMETSKQNLVNTATDISKHVQQLTKIARFGFGSFSEKPTPPFSKGQQAQNKKKDPYPYSFEHKVFICLQQIFASQLVFKCPLENNN